MQAILIGVDRSSADKQHITMPHLQGFDKAVTGLAVGETRKVGYSFCLLPSVMAHACVPAQLQYPGRPVTLYHHALLLRRAAAPFVGFRVHQGAGTCKHALVIHRCA